MISISGGVFTVTVSFGSDTGGFHNVGCNCVRKTARLYAVAPERTYNRHYQPVSFSKPVGFSARRRNHRKTEMKRRVLAILVLCGVLVGLFVWHGTLGPEPAENRFPGNGELAAGELDEGDRVVIAGRIDAVEPDTMEVTLHGVERTITVENVGEPGDPGKNVWLYGTVRSAETVDAERAIVRAPWETTYMYAVSILAAAWVLGRFLRGWRFDREELGFVPREGDSRG